MRLSVEQSYTEVDEAAWLGAVYDQDTGNLQLHQQGLKATRKGITLGNYQEARIDLSPDFGRIPASANLRVGSQLIPVHCASTTFHVASRTVSGAHLPLGLRLLRRHSTCNRLVMAESVGSTSGPRGYGNERASAAGAGANGIIGWLRHHAVPLGGGVRMTAMSIDQLSGDLYRGPGCSAHWWWRVGTVYPGKRPRTVHPDLPRSPYARRLNSARCTDRQSEGTTGLGKPRSRSRCGDRHSDLYGIDHPCRPALRRRGGGWSLSGVDGPQQVQRAG